MREDKPAAISPELNPGRVTPEDAKTRFEQIKQDFPDLKLFYLSTPTEVLIQRYAAAENNTPMPDSRTSRLPLKVNSAFTRL